MKLHVSCCFSLFVSLLGASVSKNLRRSARGPSRLISSSYSFYLLRYPAPLNRAAKVSIFFYQTSPAEKKLNFFLNPGRPPDPPVNPPSKRAKNSAKAGAKISHHNPFLQIFTDLFLNYF